MKEALPNGTMKCPADGEALHYRNHAGLLVVEHGYLAARCPQCNIHYRVTPKGSGK